MKKVISAILVMITVFTTALSLCSCQVEKEYDGKEIASIEYRNGSGYTRTINFSNGEVMESFKSTVDSTDAYDPKLVCTISKDDLNMLTNKFYNAGFFDLDDEYIYDGIVYDGYSWWLNIKYADGTEKKTLGRNEKPTEIFKEANLAYYFITGLDFCAVAPSAYKTAPSILLCYSYKTSDKTTRAEDHFIAPYEFVWFDRETANKSFTEAAMENVKNGPDGCDAVIKVFDESMYFSDMSKWDYRYSSATVTSYDTTGGDKQVITTSRFNRDIEIDLVSGRIYVIEMELVHGSAKYAFYYE